MIDRFSAPATKVLSRLGGFVARIPAPKWLRPWLWQYIANRLGANVAEAKLDIRAYPTFLSFFTRQLKADQRPVDHQPHTWVAPVDGTLLHHGKVEADDVLLIKGNWHSLSDLLGSTDAAKEYAQGCATTFYLAPKDYHRIHAPCDFTIRQLTYIPGTLWPVNAWGQKISQLFCRNERWILHGTTNEGINITMVWVGATMVGSIAFSHPNLKTLDKKISSQEIELAVRRGEELGMFLFGSTVVILSSQEYNLTYAMPVQVKMGQTYAQFQYGKP